MKGYFSAIPKNSGGQLQGVAIARVLEMKTKFIVADEPTSMLDPVVQAQILSLLKELQTELRMSFLFISYDITVFLQFFAPMSRINAFLLIYLYSLYYI